MSWHSIKGNLVILSIYVAPRSSKTEVAGVYNNSLKIKIKSPPVDNAANQELIRFLAEKLRIPERDIEIIKGHSQKKKIVCINGCKNILDLIE